MNIDDRLVCLMKTKKEDVNTKQYNLLGWNVDTLRCVVCQQNQEKASTPLLQHATGEPAVTHPYMSIKCLLLNTRRMGDSLALKIRPV
ncbi:unnamed protein product [Porites evermanni]|uniref:Uncharacterized protein n=1 Tax=Porites evermanni TaxID=104178 RepID=A0ABN8SYG1_9CNID|nr:unnamed protein product [Porites evermanni]